MLRSFVSKTLSRNDRLVKRLMKDFCDTTGLVYFGYVSQRDDEHHIVRGLTVSNNHRDNHYCIGTYEGYDLVVVERTDTSRTGKEHVWYILEIDLKAKVDIPHVFISSNAKTAGFNELLKTKFHAMLPYSVGMVHPYPRIFTNEFTVNITHSNAVAAENLITPDIATKMAEHFKGLSVEVFHHSLYIYSEKQTVTKSLLTTMLTNGTWLAEQIDKNSRQLHS